MALVNDVFSFAFIKSDMRKEDYRSGANLSSESLRIIRDKKDIWKISFIDNIPHQKQVDIGTSFLAKDKKLYAGAHATWINGEKYFLGERLGHEPNNLELIEDFRQTRVPERFRLFYLLTYPENMELREDILSWKEHLALSFLAKAEELSGESYLKRFSSGTNYLLGNVLKR